MPPMLMHVRISTPERTRPGVWLPLFLVWLILLPLVALILAVALIVDLALLVAGESYHHYTLLLIGCFELLAATRGSVVRVHGDNTDVDICFA